MTAVALVSGCQSVPSTDVPLPPTSSLLAVDVQFPVPLGATPPSCRSSSSKAPFPTDADELPELIPASLREGVSRVSARSRARKLLRGGGHGRVRPALERASRRRRHPDHLERHQLGRDHLSRGVDPAHGGRGRPGRRGIHGRAACSARRSHQRARGAAGRSAEADRRADSSGRDVRIRTQRLAQENADSRSRGTSLQQ